MSLLCRETQRPNAISTAHRYSSSSSTQDEYIKGHVEDSKPVDSETCIPPAPPAPTVRSKQQIIASITNVFSAAVGVGLHEPHSCVVLNTKEDVLILSKRLYNSLTCSKPKSPRPIIQVTDFLPYFASEEDATAAFKLFDRDGNGDISELELTHFISHIRKSRLSLEKSIKSSGLSIEKLDSILLTITSILILFISLSLWDIDKSRFVTSLIAVWAGILFAIGGTVKTMVESCIFLFITHPYDVGDRVDIDTVAYTVEDFGIMTTFLKRNDGVTIYGIHMTKLSNK